VPSSSYFARDAVTFPRSKSCPMVFSFIVDRLTPTSFPRRTGRAVSWPVFPRDDFCLSRLLRICDSSIPPVSTAEWLNGDLHFLRSAVLSISGACLAFGNLPGLPLPRWNGGGFLCTLPFRCPCTILMIFPLDVAEVLHLLPPLPSCIAFVVNARMPWYAMFRS